MSRGKSFKGTATKQIEMRRCVACRQVRHKSELLRVVKTAAGEISIDNATKNFRARCLRLQVGNLRGGLEKRHGLDKTFKTKLPSELYEKICDEIGDAV